MTYKVFEPTEIGNLKVKNKFIRSAALLGVATQDGHVSEDTIDSYKEIAEGGVGVIISQAINAIKDVNYSEYNLRIDNDSYIKSLQKLSQVIHDNDCKLIGQLAAYGSFLFNGSKVQPIGPSEVKDHFSGITAREMTEFDIRNFIAEFANAAKRSKEANFDGVQLHACHGLLLYKFLSPHYNLRTDSYGGNVEKRAQIFIEIRDAIQEKCGADFPVWIKINGNDFTEELHPITFDMCRETCRILSDAGYNAIEISGGLIGGAVLPSRPKDEIAYHKEIAELVANEVSADIITVGGIRNLDIAEDILKLTNIKGISLCRSLIRNPGLINQWKNGETKDANCISCNKCITSEGQKCIFNL